VQAAPNATLDQTKLSSPKIYDVYRLVPGDGERLPDHLPHRRLQRHGDEALERADEDTQELQMEAAASSRDPRRAGHPAVPPPLPGGGDFPVDLVIASTAEPEQLVELAGQLVEGVRSGMFMFADADLKFDQPQAEVVFDRDKLRSQGVDLAQAGRDLSTSSAATTSTASASRAAATR
jgi:multidrug efflux pump